MGVSIVHTTTQVGNSVTSITTPAISTTTGNWIVIDCSNYSAGGSDFSSITQAGGTTTAFADSVAEIGNVATNNKSRQVYAQVTAGNASHTFTLNCITTDFPSMTVYELSGLADSPLGEVSSGNDETSAYSLDLVIPDANERLLLGFACTNAAIAETVTQTGSFVQDANIGAVSTNEMMLASHLASTSATTKTLSCTTNNGNESYVLGIRAFLAPAAGAPTGWPAPDSQMASGGMVGRIVV